MRGLWSPGWIARHLGAAVLVLGFLALGYWQIRRAASGNTLSWAYAVEWPLFAGFVVFIWTRELRYARRGGRTPGDVQGRTPREPLDAEPRGASAAAAARRPVLTGRRTVVYDDTNDPELAAYNRYLAWLNAHPGARPGDYPG